MDILERRKTITSIRYSCKVGLGVVNFVDQNQILLEKFSVDHSTKCLTAVLLGVGQ
jgi:hypothetical protein